MSISMAVLAYNIFKTGRDRLFRETIASSFKCDMPYTLDVVTNGSTDQTSKYIRDLGGIVDDSNAKMWYGWELSLKTAHERGGDIIVFSADDITYKEGWGVKLLDFWNHAPKNVKAACLFLEPEWSWNEPIESGISGDQRYLVRHSIPSASWSFRRDELDLMLPIPQKSPGEDHLLCDRLKEAGYKLAALDLAEHAGEFQSAWGNRSYEYAEPLDRKRWGFLS